MKLAFMIATCCLTGCAYTNKGYDEAIKQAGVQKKGDEVIGVWVARGSYADTRTTLLLRADGTGVLRERGRDMGAISYRYAGSGIWMGTSKDHHPLPGHDLEELSIRHAERGVYGSQELYIERVFPHLMGITLHEIYVRFDDADSVNKLLGQSPPR